MTRKRKLPPPIDPMVALGEGLAMAGAFQLAREIRPAVRGDCADVPRPCPHVWCRWNMITDVLDDGSIMLNSGLSDDERGEGAARILSASIPDAEFYAQVDATLDWWVYRTDRSRRTASKMPQSCLADVIDAQGERAMHLEDVGAVMHITRERARQIEEAAMRDLRAASARIQRNLESSEARRPMPRMASPAVLAQGPPKQPPPPPLIQIRRHPNKPAPTP